MSTNRIISGLMAKYRHPRFFLPPGTLLPPLPARDNAPGAVLFYLCPPGLITPVDISLPKPRAKGAIYGKVKTGGTLAGNGRILNMPKFTCHDLAGLIADRAASRAAGRRIRAISASTRRDLTKISQAAAAHPFNYRYFFFTNRGQYSSFFHGEKAW